MRSKRELFWDIIKGIGIISIVIGHVVGTMKLSYFVYLYHLAIFFFTSSYFYNEEKYGDKPSLNFLDKLKANWIKYIFYSLILILLHNTFIKYNLLSQNWEHISIASIIPRFLNSLLFSCPELFSGAMWFVPTLIFSLTIFGIIVYYARNISSKFKNEKNKKRIKYIIIIIFSILCGIIGVLLNIRKIELNYNIHTSFLVLPICASGYFLREYQNVIKKLKKSYIAIPLLLITTLALLYFIKNGYRIEISDEQIINGYMFYIVSFIGIAFCISLASVVEKIPILNKTAALFGKHSFAIMALHFASAKLVDVIYYKSINVNNPEVISRWVVSYPEKLWFIYIIVGCLLPLLFSIILNKIKKYTNKIH